MRELKYSGVEWIGDIPSDWKVQKVKTAFYRSKEEAHIEDPVILSLARSGVKIRDISNNEGQLAESYYNYNPVVPGDLLLNPMDLYSGANCSISKVSGVISPAYINLRTRGNYCPAYYDYYFKIQYWAMALFAHGKGVSFDNRWTLSPNDLFNYYIPVPEYTEQKRIADFLDRKCAEIDDVIEKTKATIEEYKKLKQSVITEAVTKGIRGDRPMKDSGIEWIGDIPKEWDCLKAKYLFQVGDGSLKIGPFGSSLSGKTLEEGPYKIYNQAHLVSNDFSLNRHFVSESTFETLKSYEIKPGDVLFSMMGTIGKCRIMPSGYCKGIMDSHLLKARLNELVDEKYFSYVYDKDHSSIGICQLNYHSNGSIMSGLNSTIVKNIYVPLPSLKEQKEIVGFLDRKCAEIDKLIADKTHLLEEMESYKKSVIYEYVTGKKQA